MRHSNSVKPPTNINLDAATLDSPSGEEHDLPSQVSCLIPEYANLRILGLRRGKIIHEKYKKINGTPKVFGLIYLFVSVTISVTKSIFPEKESFPAKLIHQK